ncbi:MAG: shikimate dehydrogenase [Aestuariivita sp.]|nr:shikimate dehydrogenase [Aestuariivita sp.]MCY4202571.1 shikimate dehydrogenase [Aestuariivita sp.]MCY4289265.1 shikimate dehydrogenase [Aestuariivita sp.]MCY4347366.1 shikimate dehydrogenase [Aestuariivita sp.]
MGENQIAAVIGTPIAHSKSPVIHRYWLQQYQIRGDYIAIKVEPDKLSVAIPAMQTLGLIGCNVTIPHKEKAIQLADEVTDRAVQIGSANCLIFEENGRIEADNTDGYGFITNLNEGAPDWQHRDGEIVVLGAGGAARAVISALIATGVSKITVCNRTRARAQNLRRFFGEKVAVEEWRQVGKLWERAALVVNATSLGMEQGAEMTIPIEGLKADTVVSDLVYGSKETAFLRAARRAGCQTVGGVGMLLHQAVPCFERWYGVKPEVDSKLEKLVSQ